MNYEFKKVKFLKKENEYNDVFTFHFEKNDVEFTAGQYAHILIEGETREVRELSFSSTPDEENLMFTMHVDSNSDFKKMISSLKEGEEISVFKIKGELQFPVENEKDYVFLSGGVGITPYRSIIKQNIKPNINVSVAQVQRENYLFKNDLEEIIDKYIDIHPNNFYNDISNIVKNNLNAIFYVCGSKRFIEGVVDILNENKINESRVQIENFTKEKKKS